MSKIPEDHHGSELTLKLLTSSGSHGSYHRWPHWAEIGNAVILHLGPFASIMAVLIINIFHPLLKNCFIKTPILC